MEKAKREVRELLSAMVGGGVDGNVAEEGTDQRATVASLFGFTDRAHASVLIPALVITILAGVIKTTITIFLGYIFDDLVGFGVGDTTEAELLKQVSTWCIALAGVGVATMIANGAFFSLWLVFGEMQARSVRYKSFMGMLERGTEWYDSQTDGIGSLLVRIQTQIRDLQTATSQPLGFFVEDTTASLAALGIAFYSSWNLAAVILAFVPVTAIILGLVTSKLQPAIEAQNRELSEASKYSYAAITAIDTVKIFNAEDHEIWQYSSTIKKAAKSYMIQASANSLQMATTRLMTTGMFVVGFWYGVVLVNQGHRPGSVLTTFYACLTATQAAEDLLPQWLVLSKGMSAGKTLKDIMERMEGGRRITKMIGSLKPAICHGDVEVSKLTFSYPSTPYNLVIQNASLFFPAGETTFVTGRSGSGKSTLGNLLLNFYQPLSGQLLIDGHSIKTLDLNWLRNNITLVQQDSVLFNETLFQNIAFGRPQDKLLVGEDFRMACQVALLQQTINDLPEGVNTMISSGGNSMSGGQKQRIAIARAYLRDTPILILDEATSALDHISRSLVMDAIRKWRRGKTTIIITHEVAEIQEKDYVYVLDHGKVVQEGYRGQLSKDPNGQFASFLPSRDQLDSRFKSGEDLKAHLSASQSTQNPRKSVASLAPRVDLGDDWHHPSRPSRLRRVSKVLGLENEGFGSQRSSQIIPHRVGMTSMYANALRVENVLRRKASLSASNQSLGSHNAPPAIAADVRKSQSIYSIDSERRDHATRAMEGRFQIQRILPQEEPQEKRATNLIQILATVWPILVRKDQFYLALGFIFALISAACIPAFSYLLAKLLGTFSMISGQLEEAKKWALSILGIAIVDGICTYYMHYLLELCGQTWVNTVRVEALKRILAQPKAWFDKEKNNQGRLSECLDRNSEEMRNLVGRFACYVFLAGAMMLIAIIWAFIVCWKLTLVGLASGPCMYALTRTFEAVSWKWEARLNDMAEVIGGIFSETFSNIKVVQALTLENYFKDKHSKATMESYKMGIRRATQTGILFGLSDSTNSFVTALILYYGTVIAASGESSVNSILIVITLLLFSSGNANSILAFIPQIGSSRVAATELLSLANMPRKASHESPGNIYLASPLPIRLNSLSFTYLSRPGTETLHQLSMNFEAGSCTAIVGPSGSGKSTIASLLVGLYPPSEPLHHTFPSLTFAGASIFACNMTSLRHQISLITQAPVLFPCSVTENISYGLHPFSPLRSPTNLLAAAREAGIHDFVMTLPQGYATRIGDGGQGVSGGQAQRIAIARALARRPMVLIMDEPTSALDFESAECIRETLRRLVSRRSRSGGGGAGGAKGGDGIAVIIITHSLEMMRAAERIVVLEQGRVVEEGTFRELARRGGPFSRLISSGDILAGRRT